MTRQAVLAVAAALAVGGGTMAAAVPHGQRAGARGDRSARLKQELGLSDDQMARLREIRESRQRDAIRHRADAEIARLDLRRLLEAVTVDHKAVDEKVKEIADLQAAGLRARVDTMLALREVLTPEQRQKWQSFAGERRQGRGGRRSFGRGFGAGSGAPPEGAPGARPEGEEH